MSEELVRYIIHGILHLLGERDHTPRLQRKMFKRQEALLDALRPVGRLLNPTHSA